MSKEAIAEVEKMVRLLKGVLAAMERFLELVKVTSVN